MDYTPKSFKLDKEVVEALEQAAKREDRSQTAIVERALRAYIAQSKAAEAAAQTTEAAAQASA